ncbi:MAG: serine hydrolase domain-containing protein [Candidatus Tectomicrobia bacterium]
MDAARIAAAIVAQDQTSPFSGVVLIQEHGQTVFGQGYGFANRAESIPNTLHTRFGMASGCKIFTGIAICQLVEKGLLAFDARLKDCLDIVFPAFAPNITVHHLLTHSSGIPDYFDEEVMEDYEALWHHRPMYNIRTPRDFLPLFQHERMKFAPGEQFSYSNAGFIVLGLIVEQQTAMSFPAYVETSIFAPCGMTDSGYFAMDQLPTRTAYGYMENKADKTWKTNIYAVPIVGGPDGGAFTTAPDMVKFWTALLTHQLFGNASTTAQFFTPHIGVENTPRHTLYGYGVWMTQQAGAVSYYVIGEDPGAQLLSTVYPEQGLLITVMGNTDKPIWPLYNEIESIAEAI